MHIQKLLCAVIGISILTTCTNVQAKLNATTAKTQANLIETKLKKAAQPISQALENEANAIIKQLDDSHFSKLANQLRGLLATLAKQSEVTRVEVPVEVSPSVSATIPVTPSVPTTSPITSVKSTEPIIDEQTRSKLAHQKTLRGIALELNLLLPKERTEAIKNKIDALIQKYKSMLPAVDKSDPIIQDVITQIKGIIEKIQATKKEIETGSTKTKAEKDLGKIAVELSLKPTEQRKEELIEQYYNLKKSADLSNPDIKDLIAKINLSILEQPSLSIKPESAKTSIEQGLAKIAVELGLTKPTEQRQKELIQLYDELKKKADTTNPDIKDLITKINSMLPAAPIESTRPIESYTQEEKVTGLVDRILLNRIAKDLETLSTQEKTAAVTKKIQRLIKKYETIVSPTADKSNPYIKEPVMKIEEILKKIAQ